MAVDQQTNVVSGSITRNIDKNNADDTKFQLFPMIDSERIILGVEGDLSFPANSGSRADKSSISPTNYLTLQYICSRQAAWAGCANCCYVNCKE